MKALKMRAVGENCTEWIFCRLGSHGEKITTMWAQKELQLQQSGLDWTGLDWTGLDWTRTEQKKYRSLCHDTTNANDAHVAPVRTTPKT